RCVDVHDAAPDRRGLVADGEAVPDRDERHAEALIVRCRVGRGDRLDRCALVFAIEDVDLTRPSGPDVWRGDGDPIAHVGDGPAPVRARTVVAGERRREGLYDGAAAVRRVDEIRVRGTIVLDVLLIRAHEHVALRRCDRVAEYAGIVHRPR